MSIVTVADLFPEVVALPIRTQDRIEKNPITVDCPYPHPVRLGCGSHPDALRAFEVQRVRAAGHGQVWSERHAAAIRELQQAYVLTGLGLTLGRSAWPLAVGTGKTESIVAFVVAQHERSLRGLPPLTLLVCMERVAQLSDLYRAILAAGVPASFVALYHRKSEAEIEADGLVPPIPLDSIGDFPVLLATHSLMLRGAANIAALNRYGDRERSLVVWDESLIKSQGHFLDLTQVDAAASALGGCVGGFAAGPVDADARDAHEFIRERLAALLDVFQRQLAGAPVAPVEFPPVSLEDETRYLAGIGTALLRSGRGDLGRSAHSTLSDFLDHVQRPLRVVPFIEAGRKVGVIHYSTLIPPSLRRLIVLDASHNIRLLTSEHDSDLRVTAVDCAVKSFDSVTVRHLRVGAGREALAKALPRRDSALVREIVAEVQSWGAEEAGVIFTFKQSDRDARRQKLSHADYLREALRRAGLDVDALLPDGRPRLVFLTWGQHLGVNGYAYATRVLMVGVLRRHRLDLSAAIAGQRDDLTTAAAADPTEVERVELSEVFHNVVQAAGRGSCRTTVDGKALPMQVALICSDEFPSEWWQAAMPGVVICPWHAIHAKPQRLSDDRCEAIQIALSRLPRSQDVVAKSTVKKLAGLDGLNSSAYKRALQGLKVPGWSQQGRSFVRNPFA
jgi:hypothetical protein